MKYQKPDGTNSDYERGLHDALMSLRTTEQAAAELGIGPARVRRAAALYGIGWQASPRCWLFTPDDIRNLRNRPPAGRPRRPAG